MRYREIENIEALRVVLEAGGTLRHYAFQDIDFEPFMESALKCTFEDCLFLGGNGVEKLCDRIGCSCSVFPSMRGIPFHMFKGKLYSYKDLYLGYRLGEPESYKDTYDYKVYEHYLEKGKQTGDIKESLARILHDHSMNDGMDDFLRAFDERSVVGIMGGHGLLRTDPEYTKVALVSKKLTESGCVMVSGGGPGAMEATHLGAWLAGRDDSAVHEAVEILSAAPSFKDELWLETAFRVMLAFPHPEYVSLGVPTWLYGHEPATPFATHIAKYFDNRQRRSHLLPWQRRDHAGDLPGCRTEPLPQLRICQSDGLPRRAVLDGRDAGIQTHAAPRGERQVQEPPPLHHRRHRPGRLHHLRLP